MSILSAQPFVRLLFCLIPGLLIGDFLVINDVLLICIMCGLFILTWLSDRKQRQTLSFSPVYGTPLVLLICSLGVLIQLYNKKENDYSWEIGQLTAIKNSWVTGTVNGTVAKKKEMISIPFRVNRILKNGSGYSCTINTLLLIPEKFCSEKSLVTGDELLVKCYFSQLREPKNPGEIDFKKIMLQKNIYMTAHAITTIRKTGTNFSIRRIAIQSRNLLENILDRLFPSPEESGFLKALLLGEKEDLSAEIRNSFSITGTLHVLSVSGLHVGLIFFAFQSLAGIFASKKKEWYYFLIPLVLIWAYAFITGLSPSVTRAVTMISIVSGGKYLKRISNVYNALAATAFFMLCFNPVLLYTVSFQLSFLAVWGILFFQPKIYPLLYFPNSWADKIWMLISVSVAAQLSTFPVTLYYFSQFPNLFLPANLIIIPVVTFILYTGILTLMFSWLPVLNDLLSWLTGKMIELTLWFTGYLSAFSGAVTQLYISLGECIVLYLFLIAATISLKTRKLRWVQISLILLCTSFFIRIWIKRETRSENKLIFYADRKNTLIQWQNGRNNFLFRENDENTSGLQAATRYNCKNYNDEFLLFSAQEQEVKSSCFSWHPKYNILQTGNLICYFFNGQKLYYSAQNKLKTDLVILSSNPGKRLSYLLQALSPEMVVLHHQLNLYDRQSLIRRLQEKQIKYWDMNELGALIVN